MLNHHDYSDLLTRILQAGGVVVCKAGIWRIDAPHGHVIPKSCVGRMIRAGYLTGKRRSGVAALSTMGRQATRGGKPLPLGVEVTYRLPNVTGRGRVIQSTGTTALVIPYKQASDGPVCLHVLRRPHVSAPWKAYASAVGHYRNDAVVWPIIEAKPDLLPAAWLKPYTSEPRTLARMVEVRARLESIGLSTYGTKATEEKAALAITWGSSNGIDEWALSQFRSTTERERAKGDQDLAEYMEAVLAADEVTFDAAELRVTERDVGRWMNWWTDKERTKLKRQGNRERFPDVGEIPLATLLGEMRAQPDSHRVTVITTAYNIILARLAEMMAKRSVRAETTASAKCVASK